MSEQDAVHLVRRATALAEPRGLWQSSARVAEILQSVEQPPLIVHTRPVLDMDDEQFFQFCQLNGDLRIERTAQGDIVIMPPAGGSSSRGNAKLIGQFERWAEQDGTG